MDLTPERDKPKRDWKSIASTAALIISAPIIAVCITVFVFQSYEVYGLSMDTTLQDGDRLIVEKISKNWSAIRGKVYVPQRGEIIVFDKPSSVPEGTEEVTHLIKRVIGIPGDRVIVSDGYVTIYNESFPSGFDPDIDSDWSNSITNTPGKVDILVGEGEVFAMGDNRNNSLDSRNFGAISTDLITGVATVRFVPVGKFERF